MEEGGETEAVGGWILLIPTGGRPMRCALPPDLTNSQAQWLSEHLPTKVKIQRSGEYHDAPHNPRGDEHSHIPLDSLRTLTQQVTELKIELIELERERSTKRLELQALNHSIEERKKHALSFSGALSDLVGAWEKRKKPG